MKLAPVFHAGRNREGVDQVVIHTGQHYDPTMSGRFFEELGLPEPDRNLGVGSGTHAEQTARIMLGFEPVLLGQEPDWVVVYGDVNSTVACALVASKCRVRVAHVEAGLRSRDRTMPEEINRLLTDQLADLLLTPSRDADQNLLREGIAPDRIVFVGNVMVDTLLRLRATARGLDMRGKLGLASQDYAFVTLHRPANVDDAERLAGLLKGLEAIAQSTPVVFAIHPRTRDRIATFGLGELAPSVRLLDPLGYLETVSLVEQARVVITDSGGLQEETTVLGVDCLTLRSNTERPVTISEGTNRLVAPEQVALENAVKTVLRKDRTGPAASPAPEYWDGHAGERIVDALQAALPSVGSAR